MLQRSDVRRNPAGDAYWQDGPPALDLERYIGIIRRRWKLVAFASLISLLFGYAYLVTAVPIYSASTRLLIDTPETQTSQEVSGVSEGFFESGEIDSQVELIRSEAISAQVVDSLDLLNNRFFWSRQRSPGEVVVGWLRSGSGFVATQVENGLDATFSLFGGSADEGGTDQLSSLLATASDNERRREEAIKTLADGLSVARVDRTYVVAIAYRSPYPNLAAEIANGFA
ncbi:MAG: Wzz/FepE/Etk N-terminal domain-containing protein, partial [Pseudomonadota bacterium]